MKYIFNRLSVLSVATFFFAYSSTLAAETKLPLFTATSNAYSGTLEVGLTVDENTNATGFLYTLEGKDTAVPLSDLPTGIVLFQMSGKNVAVLTSKTFDATTGGPLTLTYLHDGLQNSFQKFEFAVNRQGQAWNTTTIDSNGIPQPFTTMYLTAKKLFGKVIGIDRISVK